MRARKQYPNSKQSMEVSYEPTKTDASGRWSISTVPQEVDSIEIGVYHHLCLTDRAAVFWQRFSPLSALQDRSAVHSLQRGTVVKGTVLAPTGQPVADAEVFYQARRRTRNALPPVKTDAQGRFTLGMKPGIFTSLVAKSAGFRPTFEHLKVGTEAQAASSSCSRPIRYVAASSILGANPSA